MSWLGVTVLYGFAVGASAAGITPVTLIASSPDASNAKYASPTAEPILAEVATAAEYKAVTALAAEEAAYIAASGPPVFLWRETVTRHIPEKNTWEVTVQTQTDYQADIDYEPDDFEAKIKGITTQAPPPGGESLGTQTDIGGIPMLSFGNPTPTQLPAGQAGVPEQGPPTTALAVSTSVLISKESNSNQPESSVSVYPPPPESITGDGTFGAQRRPHPFRPSKVENAARVTSGPEIDVLISPAPKFQLKPSTRSYLWDINTEAASMQNQEVYFPVSDESGHDIIKASVGISPTPIVKIAGASATLSVGGSPVIYKGHTFTLAPEGVRVGTQTFSMAAIAPAYNTDYQAVLTIDENPVTFVKDAANPTIMTAGGMTAQLGGPALVTGNHQILYNTDGALILDGTISVEPTMIPKHGNPVPAGLLNVDTQGKSPGQLRGSNDEGDADYDEDGYSDGDGAGFRPSRGNLPDGSFSGLDSSDSQNPNDSSGTSPNSGTSAGPGASRGSGSASSKSGSAAAGKNGTAKTTTSSPSAAGSIVVDGQWMVVVGSVLAFVFATLSL